jgi:hypothetical protein
MNLGRTIHVPAIALPGPLSEQPLPLGAVFLLSYQPGLSAPELKSIGAAEASARVYVTALNALAHADRGLTAVLRIVQHAPCFTLASAGLPETCAVIRAALD